MADADTIRWVSWPLRDEPWRKTALLLALVVLTILLASLWGLLYGTLALVLLVILLGPYFVPSRFELSDSGVRIRFPLFNRSRPWSVYKRYVPQKDGVFLSPSAGPSRLDSFRGDFIRFSRTTDRERVMALVRRHVSSA